MCSFKICAVHPLYFSNTCGFSYLCNIWQPMLVSCVKTISCFGRAILCFGREPPRLWHCAFLLFFSLYFCCVFIFLYLVLVAQFDVLDASRLVSDTVHFCIQFFLYFIFFVLYFCIFNFFCIHLVLVAQFDVSDASRPVSDTDRAAPGFKPQIMIQSRQAACQMLHNQQTFCFIQIHTRRCPFGRPQISFQSPHGKTFKK